MLASLFNQLRLLVRALRGEIEGVKVRGLCYSWLKLVFSAGRSEEFQIGSMRLRAATPCEARFLAAEIFLMAVYGPRVSRQAPVILDCGANCGFATAFFKLVHPDASIVAFEPAPSTFNLLRHNIRANGLENIQLVQAACGKCDGILSFVESNHLSLISSMDPARGEGRLVEVPMVRVSRWIGEHVDLLKLDVEGAEHDVLVDLIETGAISRIRRMAIEYHHRMGGAAGKLGLFLTSLEKAGFSYSVCAGEAPNVRFGPAFQDVMIYAYRPEEQ